MQRGTKTATPHDSAELLHNSTDPILYWHVNTVSTVKAVC